MRNRREGYLRTWERLLVGNLNRWELRQDEFLRVFHPCSTALFSAKMHLSLPVRVSARQTRSKEATLFFRRQASSAPKAALHVEV